MYGLRKSSAHVLFSVATCVAVWSNCVFFDVNLNIGRNTGRPIMLIFLMLTAERALAEALPVEWT